MSYRGSGSAASIAGSSDVALNSPTSAQVLTYDGAVSKWGNATAPVMPTGGSTGQALAKNSNADGDTVWRTGAQLSNTAPLIAGVAATAGTSGTVARSDHQHPLSMAFGYAVASGKYSSPIGSRSGGYVGAYANNIIMAPLTVFQAMTIDAVVVYGNGSGTNAQIAIFQAEALTLFPTTRTAISSTISVSGSGLKTFTFSSNAQLLPGMYWIGVLPLGAQTQLAGLSSVRYANRYLHDNGYDSGNRVYSYDNNGSNYSSMPSTLDGASPDINNDGTFWYQVRNA